MFKRAENELNRLVGIAWELGFAARHCNHGNECEAMLGAISTYLQTTAWSACKGKWKCHSPFPIINWTHSRCSPSFPQLSLDMSRCVEWPELIDRATAEDAWVSAVVPFETAESAGSESQWRVLVRLAAHSDGKLEYDAFVKPAYATDFTEVQKSLVDALLANLKELSTESTASDAEALPKNGLSKRQREVLELLLQGASLKEIAAGLKISRHTVNDYSKALYRHFEVSGRAELAAIFRHASHLELSHAQ